MKKILLVSLVLSFIAAFPLASRAQVAFGGLEVASFPCTCGFAFTYHVFAPLYVSSVPGAGALAAPTGPTTYPFYVLHPSAWALGLFTPGVQSCWMWAGKFCFPLSTLGTITPFTGVSGTAI